MGSAESESPGTETVTVTGRSVKRFENISTLQSRVKTLEASALPARYVIPASVVGSIDGRSSLTLPVIDLGGLRSGDPAARAEIVNRIGSAAAKWGFFQVVNHGFPDDAMQALDREARQFFQLPVDVKERAEEPSDFLHGYEGRMDNKKEKAPWLEYLAQQYRPAPTVDALGDKVWPGGNPAFCNAVHEYCNHAESVGRTLMELLAESLGLEAAVYSRHFQDPKAYRSSWRLHHYPACPDPSRALGSPAHSDTGILTILKQDTVGGLQIRKGDSFIDVPPLAGAFVVNVGDSLEAWSNGRFSSVEHRVVVNEKSERFSMVYLIYAPKDLVIECPPELIDEAHPSLYRPFTGLQYLENQERLAHARKTSRSSTIAFALRPRPG